MLSTAAFNALLKTLEEPPPRVVFIFATTDAHKIPLTILSRCQQYDFKRLSLRDLTRLLSDIARQESIVVDEKSLSALAREADGSVRDAQSLLDQVISFAGQEVRYEDVRDLLGVVDRDCLLGIARAVIDKEPRGVLERLAEAERFGFDPRRFSLDLQDLFRDLAILRAVDAGDDLVDLAPEEVAEAGRFLEGVAWEEVHALFDILSRGVEALRSASRPAVVLEMTLLKMAKLPPVLPLSQILARLEARPGDAGSSLREPRRPVETREACRAPLEPRPTPTRAPPPPPPPKSSEPVPPVRSEPEAPQGSHVPSSPQELWSRLLDAIENPSRPFWNVLKAHGRLLSWDAGDKLAVVGYDESGDEFFLRSKLPVLVDALQAITGPGTRAELRWSGREGKGKNGPAETDRARSVRREALEHPLVREALEIFEADVEEVKAIKT
jgi:DNA polymerase-3 subunit gamma/tau